MSVARGIVRNQGGETIRPPWYVEGSFYSDDTRTFKLGGDNTSFNFSLQPGESTGWELEFSSSLYEEEQFPAFTVGNLRAFLRPE